MLLVCEARKSRVHAEPYHLVIQMSTMNANEARLRIHGTITEVLVSMAMDDNATDEEIEALEEEMGELADVIMEDLGVEVTAVNEDKSMNVVLRLFSDEEDYETP